MSKSVYKLRRGLAHVTITGEPVYINDIQDGTANVTRPIVDPHTGTVVRYVEDTLPTTLLETPQGKIRRSLLLEDFARKLMARMEDRRWSLTPSQLATIESAAKSKQMADVN